MRIGKAYPMLRKRKWTKKKTYTQQPNVHTDTPQWRKMQIGKSPPHQFTIHIQIRFYNFLSFFFWFFHFSNFSLLWIFADLPFIFRLFGIFLFFFSNIVSSCRHYAGIFRWVNFIYTIEWVRWSTKHTQWKELKKKRQKWDRIEYPSANSFNSKTVPIIWMSWCIWEKKKIESKWAENKKKRSKKRLIVIVCNNLRYIFFFIFHFHTSHILSFYCRNPYRLRILFTNSRQSRLNEHLSFLFLHRWIYFSFYVMLLCVLWCERRQLKIDVERILFGYGYTKSNRLHYLWICIVFEKIGICMRSWIYRLPKRNEKKRFLRFFLLSIQNPEPKNTDEMWFKTESKFLCKVYAGNEWLPK